MNNNNEQQFRYYRREYSHMPFEDVYFTTTTHGCLYWNEIDKAWSPMIAGEIQTIEQKPLYCVDRPVCRLEVLVVCGSLPEWGEEEQQNNE